MFFSALNQAKELANHVAPKIVVDAKQNIRQAIQNLGLIYVEDEVRNIITNEEFSLDYFTGGNPASPEDKGFARIPLVKTMKVLKSDVLLSCPSVMYGKLVKIVRING